MHRPTAADTVPVIRMRPSRAKKPDTPARSRSKTPKPTMHHTPTIIVEKPKPAPKARSRSASTHVPVAKHKRKAAKSPGILANADVPDSVTPIGPIGTTPYIAPKASKEPKKPRTAKKGKGEVTN